MFLIIINKSVPEISIPLLTEGAAALFASIGLAPMLQGIRAEHLLKDIPTLKKLEEVGQMDPDYRLMIKYIRTRPTETLSSFHIHLKDLERVTSG